METEKNKKDQYFITVVTLGTLTVIASNIFSESVNLFVLLFEAASFIIIMYLIFYVAPGVYRKLSSEFIKLWYSPRIEHKFLLPKENDLRLRIHNPSQSKYVYIEFWHKELLTIRGKHYSHEYPDDLKIVRDSASGHYSLYAGTLVPNDTIEIKLGFPHNGKIALQLFGDDSAIHGFRDGTFEYVVNAKGKYLEKDFTLSDFSVWLTVKDGVLVKIQSEL